MHARMGRCTEEKYSPSSALSGESHENESRFSEQHTVPLAGSIYSHIDLGECDMSFLDFLHICCGMLSQILLHPSHTICWQAAFVSHIGEIPCQYQ